MHKSLQIRNIGETIVEGPRSLLPPNNNDDWLEKDVSIYTNDIPELRIQGISLWTDSTMNKESGFLKPIIRFTHWERQNDLQNRKSSSFPDVRVFLGHIDEAFFDSLNKAIIEIQEMLPSLVFKPTGISLARDIPDADNFDYRSSYSIYVRNGIQSLTHYSPVLIDDAFTRKVLELKTLMLKSISEISKEGWRERYSASFDSKSFDWSYDELKTLNNGI